MMGMLFVKHAHAYTWPTVFEQQRKPIWSRQMEWQKRRRKKAESTKQCVSAAKQPWLKNIWAADCGNARLTHIGANKSELYICFKTLLIVSHWWPTKTRNRRFFVSLCKLCSKISTYFNIQQDGIRFHVKAKLKPDLEIAWGKLCEFS